MSCPTVLIQFVSTQESTTRTKRRELWAQRFCEGILLQSASDISRHSWVRKLSLWIKEMIHSFAHQLYQLFGFWELGFCNAKVVTYWNTMNTCTIQEYWIACLKNHPNQPCRPKPSSVSSNYPIVHSSSATTIRKTSDEESSHRNSRVYVPLALKEARRLV